MMCAYCHERPILARGRCSKCYRTAAIVGDIIVNRHGPAPDRCSIEGCEGRCVARTYCQMHYKRFMRRGDPLLRYGKRGAHGRP